MVAVGTAHDLRTTMPRNTTAVELGDRVLMPGLIEPHSHPTSSAILVSDHVVDIRPVIVTDVDTIMGRIRAAIATRPDGVMANGWDPLLQTGLENPTLASLDELAGSVPMVILHNSGHTAFFNTAAAQRAGITRDTPDPACSSYGRDPSGELNGRALETAAIFALVDPFLFAA
ncbi:MAG: amidohydrolase family protein [Rhodoglobus sp.]